MRVRRSIWVVGTIILLLALGAKFHAPGISWVLFKLQGKKTVAERVAEYGPAARSRMAGDFRKSGVGYPPKRVVLVGLKKENILQVYASSGQGLCYIRSYPVLGASGELGPKLKEGDMQVPEGIYSVESLNPNSAFHISTRVGYPNDFDREMAEKDGRNNLGGDIMIHGGMASAGCLAMGDEAAEDIFILASDTGITNIQVILSPIDFRTTTLHPGEYPQPEWTKALYARLSRELSELPAPK